MTTADPGGPPHDGTPAETLVVRRPFREARIAIRGHSGARVTVEETDLGAVVVKAAPDESVAVRLRVQIAKQARAEADNQLPYVRIPPVLREEDGPDGYAATMEYLYFRNSVEFLNSASVPGIAHLTEMLSGFVQDQVRRSALTEIPPERFEEKLDDIARALADREHPPAYDDALEHLRSRMRSDGAVVVPVGSCHGDLTFSNVLVAHDASAIALVDFLDSFLDSPIVDLAKLRQDTRFHWTPLMSDVRVDRIRFGQVMTYVDRAMEDEYGHLDWYAHHIDVVTELNLLRIAPYATSAAVHDFLTTALTAPTLRPRT